MLKLDARRIRDVDQLRHATAAGAVTSDLLSDKSALNREFCEDEEEVDG